MRNVSQQFKDKLLNGDYNYLATAEITLEDNTTITLTNTELWTGGFSIDDAVSEDNSFTALGSTIINASKIIINNIDETYSIYDFHNATVILKVAKNLIINDSSVTESIRMGTFRVDDVSYNGTTITLALLDYMEQFDRPYNLSNLAYPATLDQIVRDACNCCGVYLNTYDFPHKNYTVSSKPDSDSVTFREVIGWAATIAGCFARCNVYGQLELKWFDIDNLINQASGTYHDISSIFSQEISLDDTVITGVVITVSGERNEETQYSSGTEGYTINIKGNEFITANQAQAVANWLGQAVIGMQFRKLNITHLNDPSIEAGDIAVVTDRKGNTYPTLVTRTNFSVGNTQITVCGSETPSRNSATRYSSATKSFVKARKMLRQESTARELQYEQLNERLDEHTGLYSTQETTQSGTIYYFHDMPDLQDSTVIWKMTSEAWGVSTDGGQTWNAGMTVDGDTLVRILSATGINADWINAGTLEIKDTNGNVIFQASKDSHSVFISGNVQMTGSQTLSGAISSAQSNANSYTDNAVSTYAETVTAKFTEIEGRIDGQIESWFYNYAPTLNNVPASNWTTEETRDVHKGDLFIDTSSGNSYRFLKENGAWTWKLISDSTATAALQAAAKAQDTADHKRRVFYTTPTPPYDQGDLWVQGENGDILRCAQQRAEGGSYVATDWVKASKYTDDSTFETFINNDYNTTIANLWEQLDGKSETFYQDTDPSLEWTTVGVPWLDHIGDAFLDHEENEIYLAYAEMANAHEGDLWHNTTDNTEWIWQNGEWKPMNIPDEVFDTLDGKAQIFGVQPYTPYHVSDLWFTGDEILYCQTERLTGEFNAADWTKKEGYTDDSSLTTFVNATYIPQMELFSNQLDEKIETWYQDTDPSTEWNQIEEDYWLDSEGEAILDQNGNEFTLLYTPTQLLHDGDLWHNTSDNTEWMYKQGIWQPMEISDELFDMIDGRATVFTSTPVVPYNKDDMWFTGTEILVSNTTRKTGSFKQSDWIKKDYYTDDSAFQTWKAEDYTETIEDFQVQMDGKIETWNQDTDPSITWNTDAVRTKHAGDIWYNPTDKITKRYSGSTWVTIEDSQAIAAQELASVKRRIFTTTPVPPYDKGDLWWTSTTDGNAEIKMSKNTRTSGVYVADDWILSRYVDSQDVQTAINNYDTSLGQTEVFNKLTNGGDVQGLYIQDGKVYINATYIMSGTLAGERINGRNIHVIDKNNNSTFYIDADGNVQINASALSIVGKNIRDYVSSSVNLLEDPYGLSNTYWTAVGTVTREQRDPMGGTNAIKLTAGTSDSRFFTNQNTNKPLKSKNTTYRFSVWLKASRTIENFQLSINYTTHVEKITVTTEWKLYTINYEVGDTISSSSHIIIGGGNSFSSGDIYIYYPSVQYTDLYMSQALIMDRLTNGGTEQGLYLYNNKVYINGEYIKAKSISANEIKDSTITGGKIANATIADANILAGTITGAKLANSTITGAKIASTTIEASNIKDGTITGTKIANATITGTQIQASTITGAKIANGTIEATNIKDATITGAKIANSTISGSNIQSATITGAKIASTTIEASNIKDGTITGTKIANATITGSNIQSATITGSKISSGTIEAANIKDGTITGTKIANATITAAKIAGGTITAAEIKDGAITGTKISDGTITNTKISDGTITGAKISSGTITGAKIANSTITGGKIDINDLQALNATIGGFSIGSNYIKATYRNYDVLKLYKSNTGGYIECSDTSGISMRMNYASIYNNVNNLRLRLISGAGVSGDIGTVDENNLGQTTFYGDVKFGNGAELHVTGSKSAVRQTKHYGEQTYYCYEMPNEMFGDIGDGVLDETGTCIVEIDDIMTEACNTKLQYYVFLQKCGEGDCWVDDRQPGYFVVRGTPGLTFSWELKAKQTGYEHIRYNNDGKEINNTGFKMPDYAQQFTNELDSIIERLED